MDYPRKPCRSCAAAIVLFLVLVAGRGLAQTPNAVVKDDKAAQRLCTECGGKGKTWVEPKRESCFACGGRGWFQRNADTRIDCVYCGGKGTISRPGYWKQCAQCGGRGSLPGAAETVTAAAAGQPPALKQEPLASAGETPHPAPEPPTASVPIVDAAAIAPPGAPETAAAPREKKTGGLPGTSWTWSGYCLTFGDYGSLLIRRTGGGGAGSEATTGSYFAVDDLVEVDLEGRVHSGSWDGTTLILDGMHATPAGQPTAAIPEPAPPNAAASAPASGSSSVLPAEPGLKIVPDRTTVSLTNPNASFSVLLDRRPVPPAQVSSAAIAGSYGWMFDVRKSEDPPGLILLKALPDRAEAGTYDLLVRAHGQECRATIEVTVGVGPEDAPPPPASRGHERLEVNLPHTYYEGQILLLDVTAQDPARHYAWTVNGRNVLEGTQQGKLTYTFTELGPQTIHLTETEAGRSILDWEGTTHVLPYPENAVAVKTRTRLRLTASAGFKTYEWKLDGRTMQTGPEFSYTFKDKGTARIECMMRDPIDQPYVSYYRAVWNVTVR